MHDLKTKKLFVFDMDGTIYLGERVFPEAVSFIKRLRREGKRVLFFTNNASHNPEFYKEKLVRLGFEPMDGEIMTSGDVTVEFLKRERLGKSVYLVGTSELVASFEKHGIPLTNGLSGDIVVTSFDTALTYEKLFRACRLIMNGSEYLSTHPDLNCPTEDGFIPDSGAISAFVTASTGKMPRYFGKPYADTMKMICSATGIDRNDTVVIGDRLYTDIALGKRSGATAVLVLTGETQKKDLVGLTESELPDLIFNDTSEISEEAFG